MAFLAFYDSNKKIKIHQFSIEWASASKEQYIKPCLDEVRLLSVSKSFRGFSAGHE